MGDKIREARKSKKMTQDELAQKSGLSRATISGLERGSLTDTTVRTLLKIADALEMSMTDIFVTGSE